MNWDYPPAHLLKLGGCIDIILIILIILILGFIADVVQYGVLASIILYLLVALSRKISQAESSPNKTNLKKTSLKILGVILPRQNLH